MPEIIKYKARDGKEMDFDISPEAMGRFGDFRHRERYRHPKYGAATVIGVRNGRASGIGPKKLQLWFHFDEDYGATFFGGAKKEDFEKMGLVKI